MKEKNKIQKGFIQIPLLVIIIASIVVASIGTGVVLYKQGKLDSLTAGISQIFKKSEREVEIGEIEVKPEKIGEEVAEGELEETGPEKETIAEREPSLEIQKEIYGEPPAGSGYPTIDKLCSDEYGCSDQEMRPQLKSGDKICVTANASDPDDDEILYTWITETTGFMGKWSYSNKFCRTITEDNVGEGKHITAVIKDKNQYFRKGKYGDNDGADDAKTFQFDVLPPSTTFEQEYIVLSSPLGGNITQNSKLTLSSSPYIVNETIQILKGVILKIEPGVIIKFNKNTGIKVGGELLVMGEKNSTITFTLNGRHEETITDSFGRTTTVRNFWLGIEFLDASADAFFDDSGNYIRGNIIKYSKIEYAKKGIHLRSSSPFIAYNMIENNELGIDNYESSPKIFHNIIRNNNKHKAGVYEGGICVLRGEPIITYNDIYNNLQGLFVNVGFSDVIIQYNNIYNNSYSYEDTQGNEIKYYDLYVWEGNDALAQNNYWGTTDILKIDEKIYDYYDDIRSGKALYKPIAASEISDAGVK